MPRVVQETTDVVGPGSCAIFVLPAITGCFTKMTSPSDAYYRERRLNDVRRGVAFLRHTDDLALRQWRHYGAVPPITTHVIRDLGVTSIFPESPSNITRQHTAAEVLEAAARDGERPPNPTDGETRKHLRWERGVRNPSSPNGDTFAVDKSTRPGLQPLEKNLHNMESFDGSPQSKLAAISSMSGPSGNHTKTLSSPSTCCFSSPDTTAAADDDKHVVLETAKPSGCGPYNTWGRRQWELEAKLVPDLQTRHHRPKRYVPMSRVARGKGRRQIRTVTDFRSGNGKVQVIRPPEPSMEREKTLSNEEEEFDLEFLRREKTYAMLKRIDRLLEPNRAYFTSDLTSSQCETSSPTTPSTPFTAAPPSPHIDIQPQTTHPDLRQVLPHVSLRMMASQLTCRHNGGTRGRRGSPQQGCPARSGADVVLGWRGHSTDTLASVLEKLERKGLDSCQKCQQWITRSFL